MRDKPEQLEWEARAGRVAAIGAFVAAVAPIASAIALNAMLPGHIDTDVQHVKALANNSGAFWTAAAIASVGQLAFIPALFYLLRASRFRIQTPNFVDPLIIIGPILLVIATAIGLGDQISRAQDALPVTKPEARDLLRHAGGVIIGLTAAGSLAFGAAVVLVSTFAGRAGLLSRFMSVMGAIVGALMVFGFLLGAVSLGGPIIVFWGIALAMLSLGRWPGGRGPAWDSGEAIPWPSAQDRMAAQQEAQAEAEAQGEPEPAATAQQPNPRAARKRKKKKARR